MRALEAPPPLILASASPRRLALLQQIGVAPERVAPVSADERPRPRELPADLARRLAAEKLRLAQPEARGAFVLAADTVVACGRRILPKPADEAEARRCLALLSGRRHRVLTAVGVAAPDGRQAARLVTTVVGFRRLTARDLDWYLACAEWQGKAGGYAIQGRAAVFVRFINGSYSNVVGLPLFEAAALLQGLGYPLRGSNG